MKKLTLFIFIFAYLSLKPVFSQQAYKLTIKQSPALTITVFDTINAILGDVVNLDTFFHVEGDISYNRQWKFWNGSLLQTVDNPVFTIASDGVFYLTVNNENGCAILDSITLNVSTEENYLQSIHVYPNPNVGTFTIKISDCLPGFSFEIFNSLGVKLLDRTLDCYNDDYSETIIMPSRRSGLYILLVKKGNKIIYMQKIIILDNQKL
jgi:hypothetical protein